jgi:hypothetical protein
MPSNVTDVDAFTDPVQIPADTEEATSASVLLFVQSLANRTRNLKNRVDEFEAVISPPQITSNQDNYAPTGGAAAKVWLLDVDAARTIKGMLPGDWRILTNTSDFIISLEFDATGQTAGYQFAPGPDSSLFSTWAIQAKCSVLCVYDTTAAKWRICAEAFSSVDRTLAGSINFTNAAGLLAKGGPVRALSSSAGFQYCDSSGAATTKSRTVMVSLSKALAVGTWVTSLGSNSWARGVTNPNGTERLRWQIDDLPHGSRLTQVRMGVEQGANGSTKDMVMEVWESVQSNKTAGSFANTVTSRGTDTAADDGEDVLVVSGLTIDISKTTDTVIVEVTTSDSGSSADSVLWLELTLDDPGPG